MPDCAHCSSPLGRHNRRTARGCQHCDPMNLEFLPFDRDELGIDPEEDIPTTPRRRKDA